MSPLISKSNAVILLFIRDADSAVIRLYAAVDEDIACEYVVMFGLRCKWVVLLIHPAMESQFLPQLFNVF